MIMLLPHSVAPMSWIMGFIKVVVLPEPVAPMTRAWTPGLKFPSSIPFLFITARAGTPSFFTSVRVS